MTSARSNPLAAADGAVKNAIRCIKHGGKVGGNSGYGADAERAHCWRYCDVDGAMGICCLLSASTGTAPPMPSTASLMEIGSPPLKLNFGFGRARNFALGLKTA